MIRPLLVSLSMVLIPRFVNGAEAAVSASTAIPSFESVIERVKAHGEVEKFEGLTRFPRIPQGSPMREEWAFSKKNVDGHRRYFAVILDQSTETAKATHVELFVGQKDKKAHKEQEFFLLADLDGILVEAGYAFAPLDAKGKFIPGPALVPFQYMNLKSTETQALFRREMDFWVKGIGRKQAPPSKATPKTAD